MAKTPSKKSAKAPKKAGDKKRKKKRTESYSIYIYKVLKQSEKSGPRASTRCTKLAVLKSIDMLLDEREREGEWREA